MTRYQWHCGSGKTIKIITIITLKVKYMSIIYFTDGFQLDIWALLATLQMFRADLQTNLGIYLLIQHQNDYFETF